MSEDKVIDATDKFAPTAEDSGLPVIGELTKPEAELFGVIKQGYEECDRVRKKEMGHLDEEATVIRDTFTLEMQEARAKMQAKLKDLNKRAEPFVKKDNERREPINAKGKVLWQGIGKRLDLDPKTNYAVEWMNGPLRVVDLGPLPEGMTGLHEPEGGDAA